MGRPVLAIRLRLTGALLLVLGALLASCGDDDDEVVSQGDDTISHPEGDEVVVQVRQVGGLRPAEELFADVPVATLVGDGTLVFEGAQIAVFPPPALPSLWRVDVGEAGVAEVLDAADEAGLLAPPPDYGRPPLADATTTVVETHARGGEHVHEVYALSHERADVPGVSPEQRERRDAVARFVSLLTAPEIELTEGVGAPEPYEAQAVAVRASPVPPGEEAQPPTGAATAEVLDWPLPRVDLADAGECLVIDGTDAQELLEVLDRATTMTRFRQHDGVFSLRARPLLPDESGCDDVLTG